MTFSDDHALETYKSLISIGTEALKVLLLLNGGAIVALLGYLGQLSSRQGVASRAFWPLVVFVAGLVAAGLTFLFTYLTQYTLYNEGIKREHYNGVKHTTWLAVTIIVAVVSLGLFAVGALIAVRALAA